MQGLLLGLAGIAVSAVRKLMLTLGSTALDFMAAMGWRIKGISAGTQSAAVHAA